MSAPSRRLLVVAAGAAAVVAAAGLALGRLDAVGVALVAAVLVVVPLGVGLHPTLPDRSPLVAVVAGAPAAVALVVAQGSVAAVLSLAWLLGAVGAALVAGIAWLRAPRAEDLVWPAAAVFLAVGALWLTLDRAGLSLAGVSPPFVVLTAVHFHYAGFAATLVAALVRRRAGALAPKATGVAVVTALVGPPLVAAGFLVAGALQIAGAGVITVGLLAASWVTWRVVVPHEADPRARALLLVSAAAVVVPMLLAVQWAVGWNLGTPALSIPLMAQTHGLLNAFGFALCGLLGWHLADRSLLPGRG